MKARFCARAERGVRGADRHVERHIARDAVLAQQYARRPCTTGGHVKTASPVRLSSSGERMLDVQVHAIARGFEHIRVPSVAPR